MHVCLDLTDVDSNAFYVTKVKHEPFYYAAFFSHLPLELIKVLLTCRLLQLNIQLENPHLVSFLYKYYTMTVNRSMLSYSLCKTIITYLNEAYIRLRDNAGNKNVHYYNFFPPQKKKGFLNK
jgi:hypothetical protein